MTLKYGPAISFVELDKFQATAKYFSSTYVLNADFKMEKIQSIWFLQDFWIA